MQKLLFFLLLGIVVWVVVSRARRDGAPRARPGEHTVTPGLAEDMVRCGNCGVHLPRSESFASQGRFYCSDEHRRLGAQGGRRP